MQLAHIPLTFRRYLRHRLLGWLLSGQVLGEFFRRNMKSTLVKPLWGAGQWHLYMKHRFIAPSFLAARASLGLLLEDRPGLVLDSPCGMGQLSHYIAKLTNPSNIVAMDLGFESAYAARRFFLPDSATVLSWDMNEQLPLKDESVGVIFCLDSFHYVREKQRLATEFLRVLNDDGVLSIMHLHNRLQYNPMAGMPLSPEEYAELFSNATVRMFPEDCFLHAQLHNEPIDLTRSAPLETLRKAQALILIVAKREASLKHLPPTRSLLASQALNPQLGSLYSARHVGGRLAFERSIPPTLFGEYPNIGEVLPERWTSEAALRYPGQLTYLEQQSLLEQNVYLDLPEKY